MVPRMYTFCGTEKASPEYGNTASIDLIVTKSVSRFARNTVDSLSTIRKLKDKGCEVFFEKENIWTFDSRGELLISIMSSLSQEESRSISLNVTWGQRKRILDFDAREELQLITAPTLIIAGSDDKTVGNDAANMLKQGIAGSSLYVYDGLGHGLFEEAKDFYDRVFDFCEE